MSVGERDAFSGLLTSLIVAVMFYNSLTGQYAAGAFDGADGLMIWARAVLWLVGYGIGVAIAVANVFTIVYVILTGEKKPSELRDERDRMIEHRGTRIGSSLTATGLLAVIIDMAWGNSTFHALNLLLIGLSLSEIVKDTFKIICYRRGF